jgi:hypothetical protein
MRALAYNEDARGCFAEGIITRQVPTLLSFRCNIRAPSFSLRPISVLILESNLSLDLIELTGTRSGVRHDGGR